jgi:cyclin-dependent kinase 7
MNRYALGRELGRGGGGIVYRATLIEARGPLPAGATVAVKKIHQEGGPHIGVTVPALREIKFLQELRHTNVIEMYDVFRHGSEINLVFPLMPSDLEKVIKNPRILLMTEHVKAYMQMMVAAISFLHDNWVLHRDIKPDNLLVRPSAASLPIAIDWITDDGLPGRWRGMGRSNSQISGSQSPTARSTAK